MWLEKLDCMGSWGVEELGDQEIQVYEERKERRTYAVDGWG